jgi:transglutaminase-like putative cysteine protease
MKNKAIIICLIFVLLTLVISGCLDFFTGDDGSITYESCPTNLSYTISYGYKINCSGTGKYTINYDCDTPEVLSGNILSVTTQDDDYQDKILATYNSLKSWNITSITSKDYDLGITATVRGESYIIADLNGANALSIQEINNQHSNLVNQYTQAQSNKTTVFIDPNDPEISAKASEILNNAGTNNAFLVAKELFIWLKQHTTYQIHSGDNNVQPACITLQCKTGDCDDLSFLYISLCRTIDIPARFIRGFLVEENGAIPHAWVEVFVGGGIGDNGWIPVECAGTGTAEMEFNQNFGVESAEHLRLFKDDGSNESLNVSLSGLSFRMYTQNRHIESESYTEVTNYAVLESKELVIDGNGNRAYT